MNKAALLVCALLGVHAVPVQAQAPYTYGYGPMRAPVQAPQVVPPDQLLRQGMDRLTGFLIGARGASPADIRAFLEPQIAPYFDFDAMARWAGGSLYRQMNPQQRARFTAKVADLFMSALTRNLGTYSHPLPKIDIFPARGGYYGSEASVQARVLPPNGYPIQLEFRFYMADDGWKVFDVTANGTSAVNYYRTYFTNLARRYGPQALVN